MVFCSNCQSEIENKDEINNNINPIEDSNNNVVDDINNNKNDFNNNENNINEDKKEKIKEKENLSENINDKNDDINGHDIHNDNKDDNIVKTPSKNDFENIELNTNNNLGLKNVNSIKKLDTQSEFSEISYIKDFNEYKKNILEEEINKIKEQYNQNLKQKEIEL